MTAPNEAAAIAREDVACPWCGEDDFDLVGLKGHIQRGWCEQFNATEDGHD